MPAIPAIIAAVAEGAAAAATAVSSAAGAAASAVGIGGAEAGAAVAGTAEAGVAAGTEAGADAAVVGGTEAGATAEVGADAGSTAGEVGGEAGQVGRAAANVGSKLNNAGKVARIGEDGEKAADRIHKIIDGAKKGYSIYSKADKLENLHDWIEEHVNLNPNQKPNAQQQQPNQPNPDHYSDVLYDDHADNELERIQHSKPTISIHEHGNELVVTKTHTTITRVG